MYVCTYHSKFRYWKWSEWSQCRKNNIVQVKLWNKGTYSFARCSQSSLFPCSRQFDSHSLKAAQSSAWIPGGHGSLKIFSMLDLVYFGLPKFRNINLVKVKVNNSCISKAGAKHLTWTLYTQWLSYLRQIMYGWQAGCWIWQSLNKLSSLWHSGDNYNIKTRIFSSSVTFSTANEFSYAETCH